MVRVSQPEKSTFTFLRHIVQLQSLQLLAISIVDIDTCHVFKETKRKLEYDIVLNRDQFSLGNLKGVFRNVSEMGKFGRNSLVALFLCVFFHLCERCCPVKNLQALESLL